MIRSRFTLFLASLILFVSTLFCLEYGRGLFSKSADSAGNVISPGKPIADAVDRQGYADQLIQSARDKLSHHGSVSALIRQKVDLFGHKVLGSGTYLQGPQDTHWMRFELTLKFGEHSAVSQQVCDGRYLWIQKTGLEAPSLGRVTLERLPNPVSSSQPLSPGKDLFPGIEGLPQMLSTLDRFFHFQDVLTTRLGDREVYALRGYWKPDKFATLLPKFKDVAENVQRVSLANWPSQLPDHVVLFLGKEDSFPYRIDFRQGGEPVAGVIQLDRVETKNLMTLEFYDVQFDVPVDPRLFVYEPGNLTVTDLTDAYEGRAIP